MFAYVVRRLASAVLLGACATLTVFVLLLGTGDPVDRIMDHRRVPIGTAETVADEFHLDEPLPRQFAMWTADIARGDLGSSISAKRSVADTLRSSWRPTLTLLGAGVAAAVLTALGLGTASAALGRGTAGRVSVGALLVLACVPVFGWALVLGRTASDPRALPVALTALVTVPIVVLAVVQRWEMLLLLRTGPFESAVRRTGSRRRVIWRHALRANLAPFLRHAGMGIGFFVGALVVVEAALDRVGIGTSLVRALQDGDTPLVVGCLLTLIVIVVALKFAVDMCVAWFDPDIRHRAAT